MRDLSGWIAHHAAFTPTRVALVDDQATYTYADCARRIAGLAHWLQSEHGLAPGMRVAWLGHNQAEQILLLFACARAGLALVPLNWRLSTAELAGILADAGPGLLVHDRAWAEPGQQLAADFRLPSRLLEPGCPDPGAVRGVEVRELAMDRPLLLVYTSGTTGVARGAVLTQQAVLFNALNAVDMHDLGAGDRVLTVLPLFHVGGLNIQTLPALYRGASVRLTARFEAARTLRLIADWRPSLTTLVPAMMRALLAEPAWSTADLSALRAVTTGSTDVPLDLIEAFHARAVPVIQVYGATETGPVTIYQRPAEAYATAGTIGRAGLHTAIRLVDADGGDVAPGTPGEILVRGPHVARGYWDPARATVTPFADGWFHSGDVAEYGADGLYRFKDRIKHVIISGGENIYPAELERILAASPLLREAAVAARADDRWGAVPVVVAVPSSPAVTAADVLALFEGQIARYKQPREVRFVEALPRTALGKVEVARLRAWLAGAAR